MKKSIYIISIILIFSLIISCHEKENKKDFYKKDVVVNESELIKTLSNGDYYKNFYEYTIIPRDEGKIYIIISNLIEEFWIKFNMDEGATFFTNTDEEVVNEKLKSIYINNYSEIKRAMISKLSNLIYFMNKRGIKATTHVDSSRVDFSLINNIDIIRFNRDVLNKAVKNIKRFNDSLVILDSNWILVYNKKHK